MHRQKYFIFQIFLGFNKFIFNNNNEMFPKNSHALALVENVI